MKFHRIIVPLIAIIVIAVIAAQIGSCGSSRSGSARGVFHIKSMDLSK